jgi:hypothetical protein
MENTPVTGLDELDKHLDDLLQDPDLAVNPKLFDDVELQLTGTHPKEKPMGYHKANTRQRPISHLSSTTSFPA